MKSRKKKRTMSNGSLSRSNSTSIVQTSTLRKSLPFPPSYVQSSIYSTWNNPSQDSKAKSESNKEYLQSREDKKAQQLNKSSAGVLFTGQSHSSNNSSTSKFIQNERLMRISECSEASTLNLLNGSLDPNVPDGEQTTKAVPVFNQAPAFERITPTPHHRRGGSEGNICYNSEQTKKKGKKGRTK